MTPRVEAWLRQARDDLAMARLAAEGEFHAQAVLTFVVAPRMAIPLQPSTMAP